MYSSIVWLIFIFIWSKVYSKSCTRKRLKHLMWPSTLHLDLHEQHLLNISQWAWNKTPPILRYLFHIWIFIRKKTYGNLTTNQFDKRNNFNFVNLLYLCSNTPAYGVSVAKLIRYARECSTYKQSLKRGEATEKQVVGTKISRTSIRIIFTQILWLIQWPCQQV